MAQIRFQGPNAGFTTITFDTDESLVEFLKDFRAAISGNRRGVWIPVRSGDGDGASVYWIPTTHVVQFMFDEELPDDLSADEDPASDPSTEAD